MQISHFQFNPETGQHHLNLTLTGSSTNAYQVIQRPTTVIVSIISGGTATVEFSLNSALEVENDTAFWLPWSLGALSVSGGLSFNSPDPVAFIRTVSSATTTQYRLIALTNIER